MTPEDQITYLNNQFTPTPLTSVLKKVSANLFINTIIVLPLWFIYKPLAFLFIIWSIGTITTRITIPGYVESWNFLQIIITATIFGIIHAILVQSAFLFSIVTSWPAKTIFYLISLYTLTSLSPLGLFVKNDPSYAVTYVPEKLKLTFFLALGIYLLTTVIFIIYS